MPRFLVDQLAAHLGTRAGYQDAFVFAGPDGGPHMHDPWYRRHHRPAVAAVAAVAAGTCRPAPGSTTCGTRAPRY